MTQEEKDLLLRDLCGRLSYGVKVSYIVDDYEHDVVSIHTQLKNAVRINGKRSDSKYDKGPEIVELWVDVEDIKPYLFPLSSMTAEQLYELRELFCFEIEFLNGFIELSSRNTLEYLEMVAIIEWFNKNHFDYRDLIPMGLAIDCTNLNIY